MGNHSSLCIFTIVIISLLPELTSNKHEGYHITYNNRTYYFDEYPTITQNEQLCNMSRSLFFSKIPSELRTTASYFDEDPYDKLLRYPNGTYAVTIIWICSQITEYCCDNTCCLKKGIFGSIVGEIIAFLSAKLLYVVFGLFCLIVLFCICCSALIFLMLRIFKGGELCGEKAVSMDENLSDEAS